MEHKDHNAQAKSGEPARDETIKPDPSVPPLSRAFRLLEGWREDAAGMQFNDHCNPSDRRVCDGPLENQHAEYQIPYRLPLQGIPLLDLTPPAGAPPAYSVACVGVLEGLFSLAFDFRFEQRWQFIESVVGDLNSTMALAPAERATLTIRKTQRMLLNETTVQSSESMDSFESTIIDKDVMNIARSMTTTEQWRADGNANFSLGRLFSISGGSGVTRSVQAVSNSSLQRLSEATQKSARRLQVLQKVEVGRQTETVLETTQKREMTNPYRDRALALQIYEMHKRYCVTTELVEIRPALILQITDMAMDRNFIVTHGEFLDETLLDRGLASELRTALEAVRRPQPLPSYTERASLYATLCFDYLFRYSNVFNLPANSAGVPAPNDPAVTFDASLANSALAHVINQTNDTGRIFAVLNFHYAVYNDLQQRAQAGQLSREEWAELVVRLPLALAESITEDFKELDHAGIREIMEDDEKTEALRRVAGFLSMVDGLVKPLLEPLEAEQEAKTAAERADWVIGRVQTHIECHKAFYVRKFLDSLNRHTEGTVLSDLVRRIVEAGVVANLPQNALDVFSLSLGFIDGYQYVLPFEDRLGLGAGIRFVNEVLGRPTPVAGPPFSPRERTELVVPTDGVYIVPVVGACILDQVPAATSSVSADIRVQAQDIQ